MSKTTPKFAIPPKGRFEYLTIGKKYPVLDIDMDYFTIYSDNGMRLLCRQKKCAHLNGGNWILKTE